MKDNTKTTDAISLSCNKGVSLELNVDVNMHLQLFDENGNLKDEKYVHNAVTQGGKNAIADQILAAPSLQKMGWMAVGTGSPAATLLGNEIARVAFDIKTRGSNSVVTVQGTFPAGTGTGAILEAGTFDIVTANTPNMWMSSTFSVINKGALDSLVISWTLTIS